MKDVLIFPGAFNPPHYGHAKTLEIALEKYTFDEVWIIPSGKRDDKFIHLTYEERRKLGSIFVDYLQRMTNIPIILRTDELDENNDKNTIEVLSEIRALPDHDITQLIGMDSMIKLQMYLGAAEKFIVVRRVGYNESELLPHGKNIKVIDGATQDISSTQIRELIQKRDMGYQKLLPLEIAKFIDESIPYR